MTPHRIPRTGLPPLVFEGGLLAEASSHRNQGYLNARWQELSIYRTDAGRYVAVVVLLTRWQGETDIIHAQHADDLADLVAWLQGVDPLQGAFLHPGQPAKAEACARALRLAYADLVGRVLDEAGLEERA